MRKLLLLLLLLIFHLLCKQGQELVGSSKTRGSRSDSLLKLGNGVKVALRCHQGEIFDRNHGHAVAKDRLGALSRDLGQM
ncbi:uncharacterized protein BJ171DRAFT_491699 [Polychytrium aggregatum]|uniref:uncharacterized protein n=1 Tax=Polychytrium aggregatum TaxID=110093 RepID=UPI0022FDF6E9|nr:uncharacterized protein BJ171DRAFT_491699 [Polychytrium aggregatum]KAI9207846.1 hypothetical protein BJ171DRAFT_491699 [Polychytrium aggregatum]